ncbi:MAG TPA: AsmA family protein, partial [Acidobacteriaceae bacterium]
MELTEQETLEVSRHRRHRRRLLFAVTLIVILLLLVLTPPLVNVSSFHRRIVASMSQSLGRPVHLDRVTLHLLPMPGFTLENLVVSEDPAFGNEPIIRANTVEATLRVSSLWKRRVEFSTVTFVEPSVNLVRNAQGRWNLEGVLVHASHIDTAPTAQQKAGPTPRFPYIEATGGRINIKEGEEKMPFSLADANFALWLPSAQMSAQERKLPLQWIFGWMRLFSARIPAGSSIQGTAEAMLMHA